MKPLRDLPSCRSLDGVDNTTPRRLRGQSGVTLVEVALAVMLIGLSLVSVVGLLYAVMVTSATHQDKVRTGNRATELAEDIDDMIYSPCPGADEGALYRSALDLSQGATYTEEILDVQYLASADDPSDSWADSCPANDQGAQRITVSIEARGRGNIESELTFVKRDTRCPEGIVGRKC